MQNKNRGNSLFLGFFSVVLVIVLALMGCGGGSSGTGTGPVVVVQGAVLDESGKPLEDYSVRVVESGDKTTTSSDGEFELLTTPETGSITLEISSETGTAYVTVTMPQDGGTVSITLKVNPRLTQVDASSLEVGAAIVGRCDIYFENDLIIRQANPVPHKLTCVGKVTVSAEGRRLSRVPFAIQYRDCEETQPWTTIAAGNTLPPPNRGVGQVRFPYIDDETHCLYRIVAPIGVPGLPELERRIHTRTYQLLKK